MKIKSLQLKNFKRFTDLTLQDIPENAKLVLLIGSNGSGKSSVFDGLEVLNRTRMGVQTPSTNPYYSKSGNKFEVIVDYGDGFRLTANKISYKANEEVKVAPITYYGRTSFRQVPRLTKTVMGYSFDMSVDSDKPYSFIDRDERFENDLEHIFGKLLKEFFRTDNDKSEIKKEIIQPINEALERISQKDDGTKLELIELIPPLEGKVAEVNFKKGTSVFHYNQLSAGEKEIFNVLLNLISRKALLKGIIYFDEIDLHLNTKLQYNFIKEIVENWIPEGSQLWTASHSLGFIQYAKDYENGCIFDFDDLDFDKTQILTPQSKDSIEVFEIAVSKAFIDQVVQGRKIIFSENTDTPFYNDLSLKDTFFFVANDKMEVFQKAKNLKQFGLIDRDYLSDEEVLQLKIDYPFLYILPYYSFENLLFHPNNLEEYYTKADKPFNKALYINKLIEVKNTEKDYLLVGIIGARNGYPFYKENENSKKLKEFKENYKSVVDLLKSDELESFYKVFPAKDYGKEIAERQNLSVSELSKTIWFKTQIENIIK